MNHCVFNLIEDCVDGYSQIYSIKKQENGIYKSYLTLEVQYNRLVQVAGYDNDYPTTIDISIIKDFCKYNDIVIETLIKN